MPLTLAIVGRPNVGKSTLFNRLAGKNLAIVHDTPGVTRDWRRTDAEVGGLALSLIDTAGFEDAEPGSISARMTEQTQAAIAIADVCLFVIDARAGVTGGDETIAQALRRSGKKIILAANKSEGRIDEGLLADAYRLGFGEPLAISAEHRLGFENIVDALEQLSPEKARPVMQDDEEEEEFDEDHEQTEEEFEAELAKKPLRLALVGRPNVGKSSLFNRMLGEERSMTGPEAGLTRDSIAAPWKLGKRDVLLHDTAGLRKKARVASKVLEEMSVASALDAIRFADCVVVMLDATAAFEKQELSIADLIEREGRAVVIAVNKWDLIEKKGAEISGYREKLDRLLPQLVGAPLVVVSALTGEGMDRLKIAIGEADRAWNSRISTATLNRFLEGALRRHATPAVSGRRVKVRYMTQVKSRPPTFALFGNQLDSLPTSYLRYLTNGLRENFKLYGAPIRFVTRGTKNPYAHKAKRK